ncbi:amino-acid N-acetyltransferase [Methanohalophilus levihalophilus]|uniref:GNAT family N-acetyltransferase n=1 Tax=Methanohalophilus levihalophilus TaxID=1431282 RepID=UPI001AEB8511|nr:GNAT family N-acetyltransferase [Methanohalophilus levihalophilus]MBP2030834.1 amino-acid N-acetyltransferase [Methanohalophilus levihalophilus]
MNAQKAPASSDPEKVLVRNAGKADEKAVDVLLSTYFLDRDDVDISNFIIGEVDGKVIGVISCLEEPFNEIHSVAVHASYRGKGIGKSLLLHAMNRMSGTTYVRTTSPDFFLKQGFKEVEDKGKEELWEDCRNCSRLESCRQHFLYFKKGGE